MVAFGHSIKANNVWLYFQEKWEGTDLKVSSRGMGLPWFLSSKEFACNAQDGVRSLSWKDPWKREWQPTPRGNLTDREPWQATVYRIGQTQQE